MARVLSSLLLLPLLLLLAVADVSAEEAANATGAVARDEVSASHPPENKSLGEKAGAAEAKEEKEGEEEEPVPLVDVGIAAMLLGSVVFVMVLFYLVNWDDDDIRRYTWTIISTTISVFTAVLTFNGIQKVLTLYLKALLKANDCIISYCVFLLLFLILQASAKFVSGAYCDCCCSYDLELEEWIIADNLRADFGSAVAEHRVRNPSGRRSIANVKGVEVYVEKGKPGQERATRRLKSTVMLLAHMCGFAAIAAGGELQHLEAFAGNKFMLLLAVAINQAILALLFRIMDLFRYATIRDFTDERVVMCCEELEEAENDIFGLATSFLLVQMARYCITGVLPNAEGEERPFHPHGMTSAFLLIGMGTVCLVLGILLAFVPIGNKKLKHVSETMQNTLGMVFAWAVLVGARMVSREWAPLVQLVGDYATMRRLTIALTLSTCAITVIGALDLISDRLSGRDAKQLARVLQNMINVLSILIGLSWEACFESGVAELAQVSGDPERTTLLLSVGTIMVVVPAWRKHILERVQVLNRKFSERREALQTHGLEEDAEEEDKASPRQETEGSSRPLIQGKTKI